MKKTLLKFFVAGVIVAVIALVALFLSLNSIVKNGVTSFGPEVIKAPISLDGVSISAFSGSGEIRGLVIGNPEGFKTPNAVKLGTASLQVKPMSLLGDPEPFPFEEHDQKLRDTAALLEKTFKDFDLNIRVVGINTRKEDADLLAEINKHLEAMQKDGFFGKLDQKWFGSPAS